jgi:hypothetical protein
MAWMVAIVVATGALPMSVPLATAVSAGMASFLIVIASRVAYLSIVPATFCGFASTFAYLSLTPGAFTIGAMITPGWKNAIVSVPISLLVGTGLGMVHGRLAKVIAAGGIKAAAAARTQPGRNGAMNTYARFTMLWEVSGAAQMICAG